MFSGLPVIDFIPAESYYRIYYVTMALFIATLSLLLLGHRKAVVAHPHIQNPLVRAWGWLCVAFIVLLLGLRPISFAFGDMGNYNKKFLEYAAGAPLGQGDFLFEVVMLVFARFLTAPLFFLFCLLLYVIPPVLAFRKWLGVYWPLAFFLTLAFYDYYGYGVNGIRNGVATSLFLFALSLSGWRAWLLVACSVGMHGSMMLPAAAYLLTWKFRRPGFYFAGWLLCLLVTSVYGGLGDLIMSSGFGDARLEKYANVDAYFVEQLSKVGFRFDFLVYSLPPIVLGYYVVMVRKLRDPVYLRMLEMYLVSNAFWLLMIRTPISNRVAYLSWFLMGILLAFPLVRYRLFRGQHVMYVAILLAMFSYTFVSML